MATRKITYQSGTAASADVNSALRQRFAAIRAELDVPADFPPDVIAEAQAAVDHPPVVDRDETGVPFWTLDPVGSMDLDQAMCLERDGDGYRVRYAIADVPAFVAPGGPLDAETRRRGLTIYAPDERTPLHPTSLSEGGASLLLGLVRPAYIWDMRLGADGAMTTLDLYRAMVRSVERRDYRALQQSIDDGMADANALLLKEIGEKRIALEHARGGASLPMPAQEVVEEPPGEFEVRFRPPVPAEDWNAQISLLTGMAAAQLMLDAGIGILRTMPAPDPGAMKRFRREAKAVGVPWPDGMRYGEFLRTLDRSNSRHLALMHEATGLFRGAGYTPFQGTAPEQPLHAAVAAPYAHVTAPLRRLVDRFGLALCEAIAAHQPVPGWVTDAFADLPALMRAGDQKASAVERACTDAVEAAMLSGRVGEDFAGVVVDMHRSGEVVVQVADPAIVARAKAAATAPQIGDAVMVALTSADVTLGKVEFAIAPASAVAQESVASGVR